MKVQIIYCHPSQKSYSYEILERLMAHLDEGNITYKISDLYQMNFSSDMTEAEYNREGSGQTEIPVPADVAEEQAKISEADCLIFLYPVWWSDCPAKLKGWFDRVYTVGYAYGHNESSKVEKMKSVKYGLVLCTAGHPNEFLKEIGVAESMRNVMIDDRLGERFMQKEMIILGGTLDLEKARPRHQEVIESIAEKIKRYCR